MLSTKGTAQCRRLSLRFSASNFADATKIKKATDSLALDTLNTCWNNGGSSWQALAIEQSEVRETVKVVQQPWPAAVMTGPWQQCSSSCGGGWQERALLCAAAPGFLVEPWQCFDQGLMRTPASAPCSTEACNGAQWQYEPWGGCSAKCGGGTAARTAVCAVGSGPDGADCSSSAPSGSLQRSCNPSACALYTWQAGPWGACSNPCAGGVSTRTVTCMDQSGAKVDTSLCPGIRPSTAKRCNLQPCAGTCDDSITCLGRGTCMPDGTCKCAWGFSGPFCQAAPGCTSNVTDAQNRCCASGLPDRAGVCCPAGSSLDALGSCCAPGSALDAAGTCGGAARLLDVLGAGCRSGFVDARGACCETGDVDECGVCGGSGNTCVLALTLQSDTLSPAASAANTSLVRYRGGVRATLASLLQVPQDSIEVALAPRSAAQQPALVARSAAGAPAPVITDSFFISALIAPPGDGQARSLAFSAAAAGRALEGAQSLRWSDGSAGFSSVRTLYAGRSGACGNGICEVGERTAVGLQNGTCPQDCPIAHAVCPFTDAGQCSSRGRCYPNMGLCDCFIGHAGAACEQCATGYTRSGPYCVPVYPLLAQTGPAPAPAPAPAQSAAPAMAPAAAGSPLAPAPAQGTPLFSSFLKAPVPAAAFPLQEVPAPGPAGTPRSAPAPAPAPKPEQPTANAPASGAPAASPAAAAAPAAAVTPGVRANATAPAPADATNSLPPAPPPAPGPSAGAAAADAPDPGAELAAQVAGAAAQLTAELGRLAKSAAPPPAPGSASFSAVGVLDAAARQQASMDTRSYSASSPDTSPAAAGSWPAMHLRLVIGIVLSSLAGLIISGLAVCCCMRCRRRAREGRLGSRLPAWLLPTPSPQRRQGSPLNLRNKYFGDNWDPSEATYADDIETKRRLGVIVQSLHSDGASVGGGIPAFRSPVRPSRRGQQPPNFGLRSQSEMLIRRPDGSFTLQPTCTHLSDPMQRAAAAGADGPSTSYGSGSGGAASIHDGPLGSARLFYNPAFASSTQASPARAAQSHLDKGKAPVLAGGAGELPEGMYVYNNVMAELNSDLGSPDARASSGRATSSSGGGSVQVYGRIEGADDVGPWDPSADGGGGLPRLALTPKTAGRLRRPSRLLERAGGPHADKENVTDQSSSPSPSVSPPRQQHMVLHHNPLSLETPPSSPEGRGSSMPVVESPGVSGVRGGGGMDRTPAGNALSLDSSHPSSLLPGPSPLETVGRSNVLFPEGQRPPKPPEAHCSVLQKQRGLTAAERRKRRRQAPDALLRASDSCLPGGAKAGHMSFVPSPDGTVRRPRAGSHEYPPMPSAAGSSWEEPGEEALAGRAFASGLASIQRSRVPGIGAKYRVVMFHEYPQELLRGWLRQHNIRDDQVDFWVLPPTPHPASKPHAADATSS